MSTLEQRVAGRALDRRVHGEVMGLRVLAPDEMRGLWNIIFHKQAARVLYDVGGAQFRVAAHPIVGGDPSFEQDMPRYSTDIGAASSVEAEIARRGLGDEYVWQLRAIVFGVPHGERDPEERYWFRNVLEMLRATPEQRCLAALEALASSTPSSAVADASSRLGDTI